MNLYAPKIDYMDKSNKKSIPLWVGVNKNGKIWLEPANKNYPNLYPKEKLEIFGVINGVIRKV